MYYSEVFINYLVQNGIKSFTHKDIQKRTNTNCSYSVVPSIRKRLEKLGFKIIYTIEYAKNRHNAKRRFRRYWIEKIQTKG